MNVTNSVGIFSILLQLESHFFVAKVLPLLYIGTIFFANVVAKLPQNRICPTRTLRRRSRKNDRHLN